MRSPTAAMLWEIWRVTRAEAAGKFAVGMVGALTVLAWTAALAPADDPTMGTGFGAAVSLAFIVGPQFLGWMFLPRLNNHRPGFPLPLLYTRPIRTAVMVGLPLAYLTFVPAVAYLASALLLRAATGYPYPLLPVAAWIAALNLVLLATSWSVRRHSVTVLLVMVFTSAWMMVAGHRVTAPPQGAEWHDSPNYWPGIFDFPLTDYVLLTVIALAAFVAAVARVGGQRSGATPAPALFWTPGAGYPEWLVNVVRFPCPTASPARAQVWFDLKSRGLPVLMIAGILAIAIPLLFAISVPIDAAINTQTSCSNKECWFARPVALMFAGLALLVLSFQGGNAFGIRYKQGRVYLSAFEAIQPCGTTRLALLKLLVRAACFLAALVVVGVSFWSSLPILGDGLFVQMWGLPMSSLRDEFDATAGALSGLMLLALVFVAAIGLATWTAIFAGLGALWTRYRRPGNIVAALPLLYGLVMAVLVFARRYGVVPASLVETIVTATLWIIAAGMLLTTAYVSWRGFAERVLTPGYVGGAILVAVAFGAAWLTLLTAIGAQPAASMLWPALLALTAAVLAPWALNRVRHT